MNTRQEKTIKTNEISSTMQCVTRSGKRKGEGGRIGSEPADGHQLMACDKVRRCLPSDSNNSGREISSELAGSTSLATESDKLLRLVRATINDQHEGPTLVIVIAVIHLGGVRII